MRVERKGGEGGERLCMYVCAVCVRVWVGWMEGGGNLA